MADTNSGSPAVENLEDQFPELNLDNYDHFEVTELNEWGIKAANELARLRARVAVLEGENEKQQREFEREDRSHRDTIDDRDSAEQAMSQAYFLITGRSPEWSNLFGYSNALEEIDDAQALLRARVAELAGYERELKSLKSLVQDRCLRIEAVLKEIDPTVGTRKVTHAP
jgi:hypothetical protein